MAAAAHRRVGSVCADLSTRLSDYKTKPDASKKTQLIDLFKQLELGIDEASSAQVERFISHLQGGQEFSQELAALTSKCRKYYAAAKGDPFEALFSSSARVKFLEGTGECGISITPVHPLSIKIISHGKEETRWIGEGLVLLTHSDLLHSKHSYLEDKRVRTVVVLANDIRELSKLPKCHNYYVLLNPPRDPRDYTKSLFFPIEDLGKSETSFKHLVSVFGFSDIFGARILRYLAKREQKRPPTFSIVKTLDEHLEKVKGVDDYRKPYSAFDLLRRLYLEKVAFTSLSDADFDIAFCKIVRVIKSYTDNLSVEEFSRAVIGGRETDSLNISIDLPKFIDHMRQLMKSVPNVPNAEKLIQSETPASDGYSLYSTEIGDLLEEYLAHHSDDEDIRIEDIYMANAVVHSLT